MTKMKTETRNKLKEAHQYCNDNDKSIEFMLEYMQDFANVDLDCVLNYLQTNNKYEKVNIGVQR